jgi:hypothetical protein
MARHLLPIVFVPSLVAQRYIADVRNATLGVSWARLIASSGGGWGGLCGWDRSDGRTGGGGTTATPPAGPVRPRGRPWPTAEGRQRFAALPMRLRLCRLRHRPDGDPVGYAIDTSRRCRWRRRQIWWFCRLRQRHHSGAAAGADGRAASASGEDEPRRRPKGAQRGHRAFRCAGREGASASCCYLCAVRIPRAGRPWVPLGDCARPIRLPRTGRPFGRSVTGEGARGASGPGGRRRDGRLSPRG